MGLCALGAPKPNFRTLPRVGGGKPRKSWVFGAAFGNVVLKYDLSDRDSQPIILTFWNSVWCPGWVTRMPGMFVRVKKIGGYEYQYLVENAREGGRHVQRVIKRHRGCWIR